MAADRALAGSRCGGAVRTGIGRRLTFVNVLRRGGFQSAPNIRVKRPKRTKLMRAHQIMTRDVITVTPDTAITDAARRMLDNHISGLPVVDNTGKLVGIVSD